MPTPVHLLFVLAFAVAGHAASAQNATVSVDRAPARSRLLAVEDQRDSAGAATVITAMTASADADLRRRAVRALGRFEQPAFASTVVKLLADADARVRAEAANALAQLAQGGGRGDGRDSSAARRRVTAMTSRALRERVPVESDAFAVGALARSLGRLPYATPASAREAWTSLAELADRAGIIGAPAERQVMMFGVLHGMNALARGSRQLGEAAAPGASELDAVRAALHWRLVGESVAPPDEDAAAHDTAAFVRRLALSVLLGTQSVSAADVRTALGDPDAEVRRLAVSAVPLAIDSLRRPAALLEYVNDRAPIVRLEAVRTLARVSARDFCARASALWSSAPTPNEALQAIDLAGSTCGFVAADVVPRLLALVSPSNAAAGEHAWRKGAHALAALARLDRSGNTRPDPGVDPGVRALVRAAAARSPWQARAWAARAAATFADTTTLLALAADLDDNVRTAATGALRELVSHAGDSVYIANLARNDHELIMTSAGALVGTPHRQDATRALLGTLARLTASRSENTRDARLSILDALRELGDSSTALGQVVPLVADFDSTVAHRATSVIEAWTGHAPRVATQPLPIASPDLDAIDALDHARLRVVLSLESGVDSFDIALRPDEAPVSVARVVSLARRGWYDGLTWHRIAPNFVIQGGSPGANEYSGDAPFMRDELGLLSHTRGAVGISTRGRDTGDAQLFVDLVDNWRLDHDYTVIGYIVRGVGVLDRVAEGDRMLRVSVVGADGGAAR